MKGAQCTSMSQKVSEFVQKLETLASQNFPVDQVTPFFQNNPLPVTDLEQYAFFSGERYTRNLIYKKPEFELLLLCWAPQCASPIHGHEGEKCWMRVESGTLHFTNYKEVGNGDVQEVSTRSGEVGFVDGPAIIHKVENQTSEPAMSLHLYARPFAQCDIYDQEHHEKKKIHLSYFSKYGQLCEQ